MMTRLLACHRHRQPVTVRKWNIRRHANCHGEQQRQTSALLALEGLRFDVVPLHISKYRCGPSQKSAEASQRAGRRTAIAASVLRTTRPAARARDGLVVLCMGMVPGSGG